MDSMNILLPLVQSSWTLVTQWPWQVAMLAVACFFLAYKFVRFIYQERIANLDSRNNKNTDRIADLEREARNRMQNSGNIDEQYRGKTTQDYSINTGNISGNSNQIGHKFYGTIQRKLDEPLKKYLLTLPRKDVIAVSALAEDAEAKSLAKEIHSFLKDNGFGPDGLSIGSLTTFDKVEGVVIAPRPNGKLAVIVGTNTRSKPDLKKVR
jgi:hypothetical protein